MKYKIKYLSEVFSETFQNYMVDLISNGIDVSDLEQIMREVERYEARYSLEFISFMLPDFIIFKDAIRDSIQ